MTVREQIRDLLDELPESQLEQILRLIESMGVDAEWQSAAKARLASLYTDDEPEYFLSDIRRRA